MSTLLLVDDDRELNQLLKEYLSSQGFEVTSAYSGLQAVEYCLHQSFSLIVLDIMMPELNGIEVLKQLRQQSNFIPIVMLTAKDSDVDRIIGLELGADDYVCKPCNPRELLARINAVLRRSTTTRQHDSSVSPLVVMNSTRMEASLNQTKLQLTGAEFKILSVLNEHIGELISKASLSEKALGRKLTQYDRSIDVHISNIRKKLINAGANEDVLINQRGVGYLLKPINDHE
ncbi:response regulator [Bermanella sp. R86510]|uniref:response regulator n=1 Tax=unclassified Bermanella TaxID=2627862 RepID=UPI0037C93D09